MNTEIRQQWLLPHPPQRVWHYLTTPELISKWLMQTDFRAEQGARFLFTAQPYPQYDFDGKVYCQVLELVPFEKLSYSWKGGPSDGHYTLDTIVTWTLTATPEGTELVLLQTGFKPGINDIAFGAMNNGWSKHIADRFAALLNENANEQ